MTVAEILKLSGEVLNSMSKEELLKIDRTLASAARKRLKSLDEGPAYTKLLHRANNTVNTGTDKTLFMDKGEIKISTSKSASLSDLRALRKELYSYLKDPTSTKRGYSKTLDEHAKALMERYRFREEVEEFYKKAPKDEKEKWRTLTKDLLYLNNNTDLLDFGHIHLGWNSGNNEYKIAITKCGGYSSMRSGDPRFTEKLKEYIQNQISEKIGSVIEEHNQTNLTTHEQNREEIMAKYGLTL